MCRWGQEIYTAPPTAATPNTPAAIRKIRLPIPSSTLVLNRHENYDPYHEALASIFFYIEKDAEDTVDEKIKSSP